MPTTLNAIAVVTLALSALQQSAPRPVLAPAPQESAPAAAPAALPSSMAPPSDTSTYIIGPEDSLQVTVWKEPGVSGTFPVRPDGMISLSLIGDLPASGLTPMELGRIIAQKLQKFIQDPNVTVTVLGVHPKQIFLLGEIAHVGPIMFIPGMTPLQAIASAGGLSPYANLKKIYILRGKPGSQQKIPYDYKKAIKGGDQGGITLQPNDTIVVQ